MKYLFTPVISILLLSSCSGEAEEDKSEDSIERNLNELVEEDSIMIEESEVNWPFYEDEDRIIDFEDLSEPLQKFADFIKLNQGDVDNLDAVFNKYEEIKSDLISEQRDSAFLMYMEFARTIQPDDSESFWYEGIDDDLEKKYGSLGFNVYSGEGQYWLEPSMFEFSNRFEDDLSTDLQSYCELDRITSQQLSADAGIIIPWKDLGEIIIEIEELFVKNYEGTYRSEIFETYEWYLSCYMWGMDNTPVRDYFSSDLDKEVEEEWERMSQDTKHTTGAIIKEHLEMMRGTTENDHDYWPQSKIREYFEI